MTAGYLARGARAPIYLLSTHQDLEVRVLSVLAAEIDEAGRELCLRCGDVSLRTARAYMIEAIAGSLVLNMALVGNNPDIVQAARYLGQRALYAIQSGGYCKGEELHGKETGCDREEGVPALRAYLVAADGGVPDEVLELPELVLGQAAADQEDQGAAPEGA